MGERVRRYVLIVNGRGGASADLAPDPGYGRSSLSGAGFVELCREAVESGAGNCPAVDLTTCTDDDLYELAVRGPMHSHECSRCPDLGTVSPVLLEEASRHGAAALAIAAHLAGDRADSFEGYGSLDTVDPATYCRIAARFGATITTAAEVAS